MAPNDSAYLSDESDFYGDEAVKQELEYRAKSFNPAGWYTDNVYERQFSPTEIANSNIKSAGVKKAVTLYNPYEGQPCGRQLGESVEEFLSRLPPSTTTTDATGGVPWIFASNPYRKAPQIKSEYKKHELANEGPPDEESDWAQYVVLGGDLLEELLNAKHDIEKKKARQSKATINKAVNSQRDATVKKLLDTAIDLHCTSGKAYKWMMFCEASTVDDMWAVVARATISNELGIAAKVAPDDGGDGRKPRLLCVYTKDFTDMEDVSRVVSKMRNLGLIDMRGKPIYYKCDAYTYLGLTSGNEYNIKASLYNSADVLKSTKTG